MNNNKLVQKYPVYYNKILQKMVEFVRRECAHPKNSDLCVEEILKDNMEFLHTASTQLLADYETDRDLHLLKEESHPSSKMIEDYVVITWKYKWACK